MLGFCFEAPVSAPSAGMGEPEPLQPQQWNGVVEAECLEPQEPQQWTGVVDAAPMPGKFGGPNTFAHLVPGPELTGAHVVGGKMDQPMLLMALGLVMVKKKLMIKHGASGPEEPGDSHGAADGDGWRCSHGWWASENGEEAVPTAASSTDAVDGQWRRAFLQGSKRQEWCRSHGRWRKKRGGQHQAFYNKRLFVDHGASHSWYERHG